MREAARIAAPAAGIARTKPPGQFMLFVIWLRMLRLAKSVYWLTAQGYALEAQMVARGLVNAACDLILISDSDTDSRALLYAEFSKHRRRELGQAYVLAKLWSESTYKGWDATKTKEEDVVLGEHAKRGHKPAAKLGRKRNTWSGLTDFQLVEAVDKETWYRIYYMPFSDLAHVNVMGSRSEIEMLRSGQITVGPRYFAPDFVHVLRCASETLHGSLKELNRHFGLRRTSRIKANRRRMVKSLSDYAGSIDLAALATT
jgi:hypothetical protein